MKIIVFIASFAVLSLSSCEILKDPEFQRRSATTIIDAGSAIATDALINYGTK